MGFYTNEKTRSQPDAQSSSETYQGGVFSPADPLTRLHGDATAIWLLPIGRLNFNVRPCFQADWRLYGEGLRAFLK